MKKILLAGCSVWLMAIVVAQKNNAVTEPVKSSVAVKKSKATEEIKADENTLLWEVSGNDLKTSSYIFGTMHLMCADDIQLSDNLKKAIKESERIYFEIDMDNLMEMMGAMKYLKMNGDKKLQDLLTEDEYKRVQEYFKIHPVMMPLEMMQYFKPYFLSSLISEQSMACDKDGGMEQAIMSESKQYNKEIKGLETVQFQASVFDSIPYVQQAKELVKYIDSADKNKDLTRELVAVYKTQDLKKIQALTEQEEGGVTEFIDLLLYNRNADWVQKIATIMPTEKVLFAVGAAHLPGEKGLIQLLRKKGFTVKPLSNNATATTRSIAL